MHSPGQRRGACLKIPWWWKCSRTRKNLQATSFQIMELKDDNFSFSPKGPGHNSKVGGSFKATQFLWGIILFPKTADRIPALYFHKGRPEEGHSSVHRHLTLDHCGEKAAGEWESISDWTKVSVRRLCVFSDELGLGNYGTHGGWWTVAGVQWQHTFPTIVQWWPHSCTSAGQTSPFCGLPQPASNHGGQKSNISPGG